MNNSIVAGAVAGFVATIPMSAAMAAMHALLPKKEQYPLPPKEITTSIAEKAGAEDLGEPEGSVLSLATHFSYGAMTGALYAPLSEKIPLSGATGGIGYGLFVWGGSYLGLLPAMKILAPATEHPARRNALMIVAHIIWGAALGMLLERGANPPMNHPGVPKSADDEQLDNRSW